MLALWNPQLMLLMWTLLRSGGAFPSRLGNLAYQDCKMGLECPAGLTAAALFAISLIATVARPPVVALLTMTTA